MLLACMNMIAELVDDMTAASAYSLLLPEGPKGRDRNSKKLTEPGLPILLREDRARLPKKEARGMRSRAVRELWASWSSVETRTRSRLFFFSCSKFVPISFVNSCPQYAPSSDTVSRSKLRLASCVGVIALGQRLDSAGPTRSHRCTWSGSVPLAARAASPRPCLQHPFLFSFLVLSGIQ